MRDRLSDPKIGDLVISETETSTWNYHLRVIGEEGFKPSGGAPPALCGRKLGWDTQASIESWGRKSHIPEKYCAACANAARKLGFTVPEREW